MGPTTKNRLDISEKALEYIMLDGSKLKDCIHQGIYPKGERCDLRELPYYALELIRLASPAFFKQLSNGLPKQNYNDISSWILKASMDSMIIGTNILPIQNTIANSTPPTDDRIKFLLVFNQAFTKFSITAIQNKYRLEHIPVSTYKNTPIIAILLNLIAYELAYFKGHPIYYDHPRHQAFYDNYGWRMLVALKRIGLIFQSSVSSVDMTGLP